MLISVFREVFVTRPGYRKLLCLQQYYYEEVKYFFQVTNITNHASITGLDTCTRFARQIVPVPVYGGRCFDCVALSAIELKSKAPCLTEGGQGAYCLLNH
jgi:hypothetical protein